LANSLREKSGYERAHVAYVQFVAPPIPEAVAQLVGEGVREIVVLPVFLGKGVHVREDIPHLLQRAQRAHPEVRFRLAPPLGYDEKLADILLDRLDKASLLEEGRDGIL